jgi:hypothetical protein
MPSIGNSYCLLTSYKRLGRPCFILINTFIFTGIVNLIFYLSENSKGSEMLQHWKLMGNHRNTLKLKFSFVKVQFRIRTRTSVVHIVLKFDVWHFRIYDKMIIFSILARNKINFKTCTKLKNGVFWVVTPCGSCKNRRFRGTWRLLHQGDKNRWTRNNTSCN